MPQFILLLHEPPDAIPADISPAEIQALIQRYKDWSQQMREKGKLAGGEKLEDGTGRTLRRVDGKATVRDGPYADAKELVAGYFILDVASYDEAAALAETCPHLDFGTIEVRQIQKV